jgi:hypothetical protein
MGYKKSTPQRCAFSLTTFYLIAALGFVSVRGLTQAVLCF